MSVHCSVVVAAEEGTELEQVAVFTEEIIAVNTNMVVIKIRKQSLEVLDSLIDCLGFIFDIWFAILRNLF